MTTYTNEDGTWTLSNDGLVSMLTIPSASFEERRSKIVPPVIEKTALQKLAQLLQDKGIISSADVSNLKLDVKP